VTGADPDQASEVVWKTNFERSYIELEELGRGRFSVVRRCQEIISGNEVAVKFINRKKQSEKDTVREYTYLSDIKHTSIIASMGLYSTSTSYAIVMTL
jgi:serine/threonine protein kinase